MNFGQQIKDLRKKKGLTQEQFALKLNVTRQAVSNWENDKNLPDLELLILMSSVFSISLDQLISGWIRTALKSPSNRAFFVSCPEFVQKVLE